LGAEQHWGKKTLVHVEVEIKVGLPLSVPQIAIFSPMGAHIFLMLLKDFRAQVF
jgi:hypothetical protein